MAVLVTGGAGFVGLNLVEALLARGEQVVVFGREALLAPAAAAFAKLPGQLTLLQGDVRDGEALAGAFAAATIDAVFPFAAVTSGPAREAEDPESVLQVNLLGVLATLRAARAAKVPMNEDTTPCVPTGLYGTTKYAVERMGLRLGELWGMDVIAARISAVFGPWERDTGVRDLIGPHTRIARAALSGQAVVLPRHIPSYHWVYARDLAAGLLHLLDMKDPSHRVFNICSGLSWGAQITTWCDMLVGAYPEFGWSQGDAPTLAFSDAKDRGHVDISRIRATGWAPRFLPDAAYPDYLAWLRAYPEALA